MMESLLWTLEDVAPLLRHPDTPLRRWAVERLVKLFPDQAGDLLVPLLGETDPQLVYAAADFLGQSGDRQRHGPALMEALPSAPEDCFHYLALALARLDHRQALPLLLERLEQLAQDPERARFSRQWFLFRALGLYGGSAVRQALWAALERLPPDDLGRPNAPIALLEAALPDDVVRLVHFYRSREAGRDRIHYLNALASAAGVDDLTPGIAGFLSAGLAAILEYVEWWQGGAPELSEACLSGLSRSLRNKQQGMFEVLLAESRRMSAERGDDLAGWRLAWETGIRPRGYVRRALLAALILEGLATHPHPYPKLRDQESALGMALLFQQGLDRDDQEVLDAAADPGAALLEILAADREHVLPDIAGRVAALGPEVVPRLAAMLDPEDAGWGQARLAEALALLARRFPGSCDAATPALIAMVHDRQYDDLLERCSEALAAVGPAAVPAVAARLGDDDMTRQIYLTGVLGEIPTDAAARAILDGLTEGRDFDEMQYTALADIGSRAAIEPLYALWQETEEEDPALAETLLVLCQLHGVEKPELPEWRQSVQVQEARAAALASSLTRAPAEALPDSPAIPRTAAGPARSKGVGKKELKRRAAQRREQRKKKKRR